MNYTEQELNSEQWVDCLGYDGLYMVSDLGRIKSYDKVIYRKDGRCYTQKGRVMKFSYSQERLTIRLTNEYSIGKTHLVSNLVFFSFNPKIERKKKQEISLKDKSHYNVRLSNLELVTCKTSKKICYDNGIQLHLKSTIALRKRGDELVNLKTRVCIKCNEERDIEKFKDVKGGRVTRKTCKICKVERNRERLLNKKLIENK